MTYPYTTRKIFSNQDWRFIMAFPDQGEVIKCLKEMREAFAAMFRAVYETSAWETLDAFELEMERLRIEPGFGVRCQELINKLEGKNAQRSPAADIGHDKEPGACQNLGNSEEHSLHDTGKGDPEAEASRPPHRKPSHAGG